LPPAPAAHRRGVVLSVPGISHPPTMCLVCGFNWDIPDSSQMICCLVLESVGWVHSAQGIFSLYAGSLGTSKSEKSSRPRWTSLHLRWRAQTRIARMLLHRRHGRPPAPSDVRMLRPWRSSVRPPAPGPRPPTRDEPLALSPRRTLHRPASTDVASVRCTRASMRGRSGLARCGEEGASGARRREGGSGRRRRRGGGREGGSGRGGSAGEESGRQRPTSGGAGGGTASGRNWGGSPRRRESRGLREELGEEPCGEEEGGRRGREEKKRRG